jgi:hypothetical protein
MKSHLLAAAIAALAIAGPALAADPEDPMLGPKAQAELLARYHIQNDPVAIAIVEKMRQCVANEPWGLPGTPNPPRTGVVLTDHCYREARGVQ